MVVLGTSTFMHSMIHTRYIMLLTNGAYHVGYVASRPSKKQSLFTGLTYTLRVVLTLIRHTRP